MTRSTSSSGIHAGTVRIGGSPQGTVSVQRRTRRERRTSISSSTYETLVATPEGASVVHTSQDDAGVVPAEAERVVDGVLHVRLARLVRDVVEIAVGIGCVVVDRRRQDAL